LWQPQHLPLALTPLAWHQHEMLVGLLNAAIAGFLLTAVCNWTRTRPTTGLALAGLWLLWLAGRLVMAMGELLPPWAEWVDLLFLPLVAVLVLLRVVRARQWRQLPVVVVVLSLWGMDLGFHVSGDSGWIRHMVVLAGTLILVLGGRITPAFSRNWLHIMAGRGAQVRSVRSLDVATLLAALLLVVVQVAGVTGVWLAATAFAAAALAALRLVLWRGWLVREEPLLWVLHIGVLWVVLGFGLRGLAALGVVSDAAWVHALGVGAMGTMIIGVMTRVSLGHTGRELLLPPGMESVYWLMIAAAMIRVLAGLNLICWYTGLWAAGVCWSLAFLRFIYGYADILTSPRVDGREG